MIGIAAYQPDHAHNVGGLIRLGVCFAAEIHVIEPCGFPFSLKAVRQSALDYADAADISRHDGWSAFKAATSGRRLALLTTRAEATVWEAAFRPTDILLCGQESAGAPDAVHAAADLRLTIPTAARARSLNVVTAAAIALGEARRQLGF